MKISKAKLRQIIREELNNDENETLPPLGPPEPQSPRRAQRAHALTKDAPVNALLQALRVVSSPMLDATIRKLAFDVAKDLKEADFNDFVEALDYARDPHGEGF